MSDRGKAARNFLFAAVLVFMCTGIASTTALGYDCAVPSGPVLDSTDRPVYVYQPYGMPQDWYVTADGYPVKRRPDGRWVYGTYSGNRLTATGYVVGTAIPHSSILTPYIGYVPVSVTVMMPVVTAKEYPLRVPDFSGTFPPVSAPSAEAEGVRRASSAVSWQSDPHFLAMGTWRKDVDRIGILRGYGIPVAWQGKIPLNVYAWDGRSWQIFTLRKGERPAAALKRNLRALTPMAERNNPAFYKAHVSFLIRQAALWNYYWMGEVRI